MQQFDLGIGWLWEFDAELVDTLERECHYRRRISTYRIDQFNLGETAERVKNGQLHFRAMLDRGFDIESGFETIGRSILAAGGHLVNDYDQNYRAIDKATMHLEFIEGGLHVPYTIIISPHSEVSELELSLEDLAHLGSPFIIKPANTTGGGIGVVRGAEGLLDVLTARQEFTNDKYLLQEFIHPRVIAGKRCWFRCFYVYGKVFLSWWDDLTHQYTPVTTDEEHYYRLGPLKKIMKRIAEISGLNFFSSEIALRESTTFEPSQFVVIDYVNDMCDMRSERIAADGLPNVLFQRIVERLALSISKIVKQK